MNTVFAVSPITPPRIDTPILERFARRNALRTTYVEKLGDELVRFLVLCATTQESLAPSPIVDDLWHHFILDTRSYAEWCVSTFGAFIHHVPSDEPESDAYCRTLELLVKRFGPTADQYWPAAGDPGLNSKCRGCGSKCRS
jgi:hypothetical protein